MTFLDDERASIERLLCMNISVTKLGETSCMLTKLLQNYHKKNKTLVHSAKSPPHHLRQTREHLKGWCYPLNYYELVDQLG